MADFKINNQHAQVIQQADSITNNSRLIDGSPPAGDLQGEVGSLITNIADLIKTGELDADIGAEICAAIEEAAVATDHGSMINALHRAGKIAAGITALGGVAESIHNIISLVTGGS